MATGYKLFLPNGSMQSVVADNIAQKMQICQRLIDRWRDYCCRNWIGNASKPYSPENKVKGFLNGLGTFLVAGSGGETSGIVTRYKEMANGKRQIPVSSCPSYIAECMYGMIHTGNKMDVIGKEQQKAFNDYMQMIDEKAASSYKSLAKKKPPARKQTRSDRKSKIQKNGAQHVERCVVDTDGFFSTRDGARYRIDLQKCVLYAPKQLKTGDVIYDMDMAYVAYMSDGSIMYYDQEYREIEDQMITVVRCD